jgi:beta-1,4-mannooligosaccharide/beta-1,4-mannosyl-N-acetylglucosamine phosphorylase
MLLLSREQPWKVKGLYQEPLMVPEETYEVDGFRGNVLFPGGAILEEDGEVKIFYGAADTVVCLATCHIDELLDLF